MTEPDIDAPVIPYPFPIAFELDEPAFRARAAELDATVEDLDREILKARESQKDAA